MPDPFDLNRFVSAQDPLVAQVRGELADGRKRSHWMWFVFPQLAGLGSSSMARHYALPSLDAARAYLGHEVLGARLEEWTGLVNRVEGRSVGEIFGSPDDMKFRSSMTLFAQAAPDASIYRQALAKYFAGAPDALTLRLLGRS